VQDLQAFEMINLGVLMAGVIWIGIFPQTVINTAKTAINKIQSGSTSQVDDKFAVEQKIKSYREPEVKNVSK
jgi:NADH:ubiquinone oxidoreductase subunit 4 (subunit M)